MFRLVLIPLAVACLASAASGIQYPEREGTSDTSPVFRDRPRSESLALEAEGTVGIHHCSFRQPFSLAGRHARVGPCNDCLPQTDDKWYGGTLSICCPYDSDANKFVPVISTFAPWGCVSNNTSGSTVLGYVNAYYNGAPRTYPAATLQQPPNWQVSFANSNPAVPVVPQAGLDIELTDGATSQVTKGYQKIATNGTNDCSGTQSCPCAKYHKTRRMMPHGISIDPIRRPINGILTVTGCYQGCKPIFGLLVSCPDAPPQPSDGGFAVNAHDGRFAIHFCIRGLRGDCVKILVREFDIVPSDVANASTTYRIPILIRG